MLVKAYLFVAVITLSRFQGSLAYHFVCNSGNHFIDYSLICDGKKDCPDGSDEGLQVCSNVMCPPNKFHCYYGGCVNTSAICNGVSDCTDHSDESHCGRRKGSCEKNEFKCQSSQECIPTSKLCNRNFDCVDKSDESLYLCHEVFCPADTYRCKIGRCIHLNQKCDGFRDCIDGSDESDLLCKKGSGVNCKPINSTRIVATCEAPGLGLVPCNQTLPPGTHVKYECKPFYVPANGIHVSNKEMVCQGDGNWNRGILKCIPDCGRASSGATPLIVNGWKPQQEHFPWHGVLYTLNSGNWTFTCGASLITEKILVTAAHCTWNVDNTYLSVVVGKSYSDYYREEEGAQIRNVQTIIQQSLYQDLLGNYGSDIALLVVAKPFQLSKIVQTICVNWHVQDNTQLDVDDMGLIVGFGITENDTFSEQLRATYLPVVNDDQCIETQKRDFKKYITFTSFCAGWTNGTSVCNGDSGAGLVFPSKSKAGAYTLKGIVSISPRRLGTSFCDPSYYTIFTKVENYVEWIHRFLEDTHRKDDVFNPYLKEEQITGLTTD